MASSTLVASRRARLLDGPVAPVLFSLSWPMTVGLFAVIAINVTDTFYIGRLGTEELAAIGYCFPVIFGMSAIAIGVGNGATSVVSRALGAGQEKRARMLTTNTLLFVLIWSLVLAGAMYALSEEVFSLLALPARLQPHVDEYMDVWYAGLPFLIVPIVLNGLIRASGEAIVPSVLMVLAAAINAIVSPLLIFGLLGLPALGMAGAAWATVGARGLIAALCVVYLLREDLMEISRETFAGFFGCVADVARFGAPAFLAQLVSPVSGAIITRILSEQGAETVAAYAVGARIESLALIPFFALQSGIAPFIGQNVGAARTPRLRRAEMTAIVFALGWGLLAGLILFGFGGSLGGLFTADPAIAALTDRYLGLVGFGLFGAGLVIVSTGVFNPLGYPNLAMVLSVLRYLVLYAGLAALAHAGAFPFFSEVTGIFLAAPVSYVLAGLTAFTLVHLLIERPKRAMVPPAEGPRPIVGHDDLRPNRHPSAFEDEPS
nr:MATE family efflux transporter [Parvularcula oceani]